MIGDMSSTAIPTVRCFAASFSRARNRVNRFRPWFRVILRRCQMFPLVRLYIFSRARRWQFASDCRNRGEFMRKWDLVIVAAGFASALVLPHSASAADPVKVIYSFKGGKDGAVPIGPLVDVGGTLYGTTSE